MSSFDLMRYKDKPNYKKMIQAIHKTLRDSVPGCEPDFYDSIQVNWNIKTKMHTDGINTGPSLCMAVGEHEGGELVIEEKDGLVVRDVHSRVLFTSLCRSRSYVLKFWCRYYCQP